jgi:hypothetical protein
MIKSFKWNPLRIDVSIFDMHVIRVSLVIISLLCLFSSVAMSQRKAFGFQNLQDHDEKRYHFGFSLGVNKMGFALKPNYEDPEFRYTLPEPDYGFHIGIVSNLKLARLWDLRFVPTLSFGDRYIYYHDYDSGFIKDSPDRSGVFDPTLLEFPVHFKFKSVRMTNTRVYLIGGLKYSYDLASIEEGTGEEILVRVARNDFHYEMGVGFDYYFYYFKFSAEIKASFGMANLAREGDFEYQRYFSSIDRLNSQSIMISFLFE